MDAILSAAYAYGLLSTLSCRCLYGIALASIANNVRALKASPGHDREFDWRGAQKLGEALLK